jgi:hypothetical protein
MLLRQQEDVAFPSEGLRVLGGRGVSHERAVDAGAWFDRRSEAWRTDLDALARAGVRHVRYSLPWRDVQPAPGVWNWSEVDRFLERAAELGLLPCVELVHPASCPSWVREGAAGDVYGAPYVEYAAAVAERYPWVPAYSLFSAAVVARTVLDDRGGGVGAPSPTVVSADLLRILRGVAAAEHVWRERAPGSLHLWELPAEHHRGIDVGRRRAELANDRRLALLDLVLGHDLDQERPFLGPLLHAGDEQLMGGPRLSVDVLGLEYGPRSEWFHSAAGACSPSPVPVGLREVIDLYGSRYGLPIVVTGRHVTGTGPDRVSWLRHLLEQYDMALGHGHRLLGVCWSRDRTQPVSALFQRAWEAVALGLPWADLPAYCFTAPCLDELRGFLPLMKRWPWEAPPETLSVR